jgi:hypothetical protein
MFAHNQVVKQKSAVTDVERPLEYLSVTAEIPASVNLIEHHAGGNSGSWRGWVWLKPGMRITIWTASFVDALQFNDAEKYGGAGGNSHVYQLDEGEEITGISGNSGDWMDGIQFRFSSSRSEYHGGNGGQPFDWQFEHVGRIHAIGLRAGVYVHRICILSDH